ncbi:MAG TPA: glycosyltransferase family 2 protein [Oligoflexia bacterium]|nr:glycosyltransferase family 2 protein [Oligoflexia bacterium]
MKTLNVIIPYFNEAQRMEPMIVAMAQEIAANDIFDEAGLPLRFIWVDDGSTDNGRMILETLITKHLPNDSRLGAFQVHHEFVDLGKNSGKASAMHAGIQRAKLITTKNGESAIVSFWDADGELLADGLFSLIYEVYSEKADIAFGSRFNKRNPQVLNFRHYLGNKSLTVLSNWFSDLNLSDVHCCARAIRIELLAQIPLKSKGFDFEAEFVGLIGRISSPMLKLTEVPLTYLPRTREEGKKIGIRHVLPQIWQAIRCRYFVKNIELRNF